MANRVFIVGLIGSLMAGGVAAPAASAQFCAPAPPMPLVATDSGAGPANPADVASIQSIVAALYDVISGPAGHARDWKRFKSLFIPGGRLIPTRPCKEGGNGVRVVSVGDFAAMGAVNFEKNGFYEKGIATHIDRYGDVAQVFTTYESRHTASDPKPFARGINSMQFFYDGKRWWCVTIFWDAERPDNPIPTKYLPQ